MWNHIRFTFISDFITLYLEQYDRYTYGCVIGLLCRFLKLQSMKTSLSIVRRSTSRPFVKANLHGIVFRYIFSILPKFLVLPKIYFVTISVEIPVDSFEHPWVTTAVPPPLPRYRLFQCIKGCLIWFILAIMTIQSLNKGLIFIDLV